MYKTLIFLENFITIVSSLLGIIMIWTGAVHVWIELGWVYGILLFFFAMVVSAYLVFINLCRIYYKKG